MKSSFAANLAIFMVMMGWLLIAYSYLSVIGDPFPGLPKAVIAAQRSTSFAIYSLGIFGLLSSIWLSGFAFLAARWRASIALASAILPIANALGMTLFRH